MNKSVKILIETVANTAAESVYQAAKVKGHTDMKSADAVEYANNFAITVFDNTI